MTVVNFVFTTKDELKNKLTLSAAKPSSASIGGSSP
ncbi:hypothetical protein M2349_001643 [Caldanaerobacter subterraneus subsp. tengcongensis MB4]|nr:hypothetical protein O163_11185 [Caldanaerobacter subterraneus subsp. yonseiensis KB-1]MCS3916502.1 hypothetical protein [Caldanaerobacter subterraneus subsp. tengcongensis MB4]